MAATYSTYEAKAKFSEIMRRVRAGQRVVISYRGQEIAEVRPLEKVAWTLRESIGRLEEEGRVSRRSRPAEAMASVSRRPGALRRFLDSRD